MDEKELKALVAAAASGNKAALSKLKKLVALGQAVESAFTKVYGKPKPPRLRLVK